ncbi:hypothetical protein TSUD_278000 [Trifolium subterraneum]|uniref:RNase H type-1 domain-containing protein n=1 Tax=Trifolium subterraneum TaxID=3900 RepID=A0A2Z6N7N8_TRISU|nr:hypothetical protein TSUD_278000 [Trifolium subterraneum]
MKCRGWAAASHCLWSWRNKEEHEDPFQRPTNPMVVIADKLKQYHHPDMQHHVLYNIRTSGCGGAIRDSNGVQKGGFAKKLGVCSAYVAELWDVLEGLRYARRLGFTKIELNVDSKVVTHVLYKNEIGNPLGGTLVSHIRRLLDLDWEVVINHSYREVNKCANVHQYRMFSMKILTSY